MHITSRDRNEVFRTFARHLAACLGRAAAAPGARQRVRADLSVPLFEGTAGLPFGTSPMAMCNLAAPGADRHLAALSARHRVPLGVSTISSTPLERIVELADGHA